MMAYANVKRNGISPVCDFLTYWAALDGGCSDAVQCACSPTYIVPERLAIMPTALLRSD